jgi:putative transposase
MNGTNRPPATPSAEALLRYAVLSHVESLVLGGWAPGAALGEVAGREHTRPDGRTVRVSVRTLQRWRAAYASGGLAALEPASRRRTDSSVALGAPLLGFVIEEKRRDPRASVPELLRRARQRGLIATDLPVDRVTVWRACQRLGLPTRIRPSKQEGEMRRWRYPHRMQCVLADGKHFRAGAARLRRVAVFFLDDATRYALGVVVGTSESAALFLGGLHDVVRRYGVPDLLYLDHGPGFISGDTLAMARELGAWLIHGQAKYPEGHGVIERFHRTAYEQLLRSLDGAADVDPDCGALTLRLRHYLDLYNDTPHETLGGETPRERWRQGRPLRFPDGELHALFVVREARKVSADHVIRSGGRLWEAPRGLAGQTVMVTRHLLDGRLRVQDGERMIELAELDPHANATARRGSGATGGQDRPLPSEGVPESAATLAFKSDLAPLTGPDGGFRDAHEDDDETHAQEDET